MHYLQNDSQKYEPKPLTFGDLRKSFPYVAMEIAVSMYCFNYLVFSFKVPLFGQFLKKYLKISNLIKNILFLSLRNFMFIYPVA